MTKTIKVNYEAQTNESLAIETECVVKITGNDKQKVIEATQEYVDAVIKEEKSKPSSYFNISVTE